MENEKIQSEVVENSSQNDSEKAAATPEAGYLPNEARDDDVVTLKTWIVVVVRSSDVLMQTCSDCDLDPLRFLRLELLDGPDSGSNPNPSCD